MYGIKKAYEVDPRATDRNRVFRIPGTLNWKRGGHQTRLLRDQSTFMRMKAEHVVKAFPVVEAPRRSAPAASTSAALKRRAPRSWSMP